MREQPSPAGQERGAVGLEVLQRINRGVEVGACLHAGGPGLPLGCGMLRILSLVTVPAVFSLTWILFSPPPHPTQTSPNESKRSWPCPTRTPSALTLN